MTDRIKKFVDYLSDEFQMVDDNSDDEPSTLKDSYSGSSDETGSLKDFIVGDSDEEEEEIEPSPKIRTRNQKRLEDGIYTTNIVSGKRRRKPVEEIYKPPSAIYEALVLNDVDVEYFHDTLEKDLKKIEEKEGETSSFEPDDSMDEDEDPIEISESSEESSYSDEYSD